jgi:hypothetical protein
MCWCASTTMCTCTFHIKFVDTFKTYHHIKLITVQQEGAKKRQTSAPSFYSCNKVSYRDCQETANIHTDDIHKA